MQRIFTIQYLNDTPYHENVEIWKRNTCSEIMKIIKNPDMKWLQERDIKICSYTLNSENEYILDKIYYEKGDNKFKINSSIISKMKQDEIPTSNLSNIKECKYCFKMYKNLNTCNYCKRELESE